MKTVESLTSGSILLLGDFMLDRYIHGDIDRISPEAPVPVMKALTRQSQPGGAGSVAANIRALGAGVTCLGIVGDDDAGSEICRKLSLAGANIDHLLSLPGRGTTVKERFVGLAQHRHGQQMLRVDYEDSSELPKAIQNQLIADIEKLLNVLNRLVDKGNTVLVIEHNPDVIKVADYIVDLGPEGGDEGGNIVCCGSPEEVARNPRSYTGQILKEVLREV